jgi:mitochondrial fission protein ELM1
MAEDSPVWVLLGGRTGDNNQLLRLAAALGHPFRTLDLRYNALHLLPPRLLGASLTSLEPNSRKLVAQPWPRVVLGIGHRSAPVALAIRALSGGTSKLVRLGNPRLDPGRFDLVITTPQYRIPAAPNVLRLAVGISTAAEVEPSPEESEWLGKLARPHRLLLLGGDTFMWKLGAGEVLPALSLLTAKPGSVLAVGSGRSSKAMLEAVAAALAGSGDAFVGGRSPRYPVLIEDADEIYVTADSVAMISDAIASGKPVGLIEPSTSVSGKLFYGLRKLGVPVPVRDVRRFWTGVQALGLAGTVKTPAAGKLDREPLDLAVAAVRKLL